MFDLCEVPDGGDGLYALLVHVPGPLKQPAPDIVVRKRVPEMSNLHNKQNGKHGKTTSLYLKYCIFFNQPNWFVAKNEKSGAGLIIN